MRKNLIFGFLFLFIIKALAQSYLWPTDASRAMTSSFAESRPGRFHAGIDIKTWGQVGYKVFAVRPGHISQIRVSPYGYGKALYLALDTGETVVYAHLDKFNPELEEYVWDEQLKRGRYDIQLYPTSTRFRYDQGDLLGYTGKTGIGFPHLHFEMRDVAGRPINPLSKGFEVDDKVTPTISRIAVTPMDALSTVRGDWRPVTITPVYLGNGRYRINEPIPVTGRIALGVSAYDRMSEINNKFGSYINQLYVDGQLIFQARYDRYSYSENNHATLDRDFRFLATGRGYFYNLFLEEGNRLPFYNTSEYYAGVLDFGDLYDPEGNGNHFHHPLGLDGNFKNALTKLSGPEHSFEIHIADYWGNTAILSGQLVRDDPITAEIGWEAATILEPVNFDFLQVDLSYEFYDRHMRIEMWIPPNMGAPPTIYGVHDDGIRRPIYFIRRNHNRYVAAWSLKSSDSGPLTLEAGNPSGRVQRRWIFYRTVAKGENRRLYSQDGQCRIDFSSNSLFKDIYVRTQSQAPDTNSSTPFASAVYRIEPIDVALDGGAVVSIRRSTEEPQPEKLAFYYSNGKNGWVYLGNRTSQDYIGGRVSSFGTYALLRDVVSPTIDYLIPQNNARIADRRPIIKASFKDELSGISGEENMVLRLDGKKLIAEYDPENYTLTFAPREDLMPGDHTLSLLVRDRCGNESAVTHQFVIE